MLSVYVCVAGGCFVRVVVSSMSAARRRPPKTSLKWPSSCSLDGLAPDIILFVFNVHCYPNFVVFLFPWSMVLIVRTHNSSLEGATKLKF